MASGIHGHGQTGVTEDLLQGQDVAAALDEVTGEGYARLVPDHLRDALALGPLATYGH